VNRVALFPSLLRARFLFLAISLAMSANLTFGAFQFTDVTAEAGINHLHSHTAIGAFTQVDHALITGGAVAEDFDGDGWIDLYVLQGGDAPNLLYINQRDGTFRDEAAPRGADLTGYHVGVAAADYDNDGDIDIFISSATAPHVLLINDGSGHFTVSDQSFLYPEVGASSPSWVDIDNDGHLELALGPWVGFRSPRPENAIRIYKNDGFGNLDPSLSVLSNWTFIPHFLDIDNDRQQDLFAVSDFGRTVWHRNYGNGLFLQAGKSDIDNAMGISTGDIDNDGDLDVFLTSIFKIDPETGEYLATGNRLLLNNGQGDFEDITDAAGVRDGGWGWGSEMADFDNDGDLDIYHVAGWSNDLPAGTLALFGQSPSRLFENLGSNRFVETAALSGDAAHKGQGRCVIAFDYDNDGDLDLFIANGVVPTGTQAPFNTVTHGPSAPVLLRNDTSNDHRYLKVQLEGTQAPHHRHGIGARLYLRTGATEQLRELNASSGFNGHGPRRMAHFGLGQALRVDRILAVWTNHDTTEVENVASNQTITLSSPRATVSRRHVLPGETFTLEFPADALPPGAMARWRVEGENHSNFSTLSLAEPGVYSLHVQIVDETTSTLHWAESLRLTVESTDVETRSIAQIWNEDNLAAIRIDFPNPATHARNLFALSLAMWDAWAAHDAQATGVLHHTMATAHDLDAARQEAISYAAYRVIRNRYALSVNASTIQVLTTQRMLQLGYDPSFTDTTGDSPAALGNRIAATVIAYTATDGWDDLTTFHGGNYAPINSPLEVKEGGTLIDFPNHWQPLLFEEAFTQNGQTADLVQSFIGSNWGGVRPFSLSSLANGSLLHFDPGPPPELGGATDQAFKDGNVTVIELSSLLDPTQSETMDISPGAMGNNSLGYHDGTGHPINPHTNLPYPPNIVKHADFGRVLAEYWADGPESETPPGHWNVLANQLHDHPDFRRQFEGTGPELDRLEWDVKVYLALNGALHDAAIAAWGCKRVYDFVRPISSIRYLGGRGQSTDPQGFGYDSRGLPLVPNLIEVITAASIAPGQHHHHLSAHLGEIAIRAWSAGEKGALGKVDWIRAADWLPYQSDTFVTPAFPGYVSGHSTFSRAAAEVLARMTGDVYFPGGLKTFTAKANAYLKFEPGPTTDIVLQWATYYDAADQAGLSRIYGGIHVPADDGPGRIIGSQCGLAAWNLATRYFDGSITAEPFGIAMAASASGSLQIDWQAIRGAYYQLQSSTDLINFQDMNPTNWIWAEETTESLVIPAPPDQVPQRFYRLIRLHESPN
jgi:hypothetical protein